MKKKEQYKLGEAIQNFYKTEPLKIDLANATADKIFVKTKDASPVFDKWLYTFAAILFAIGMIYCFSIFSRFSLQLILLTLVPAACYFGLSVKEHLLISKRLISFE